MKRHIQSAHRNKLVRAADCNIISELFERQNTSAANENIDVSIQEEDYNNNSNENINVSIQEEDNNNNNTNIPEKSIQNTQYPVSDFQNILESVLDGKLKQHAIAIMDLIKTQLTNQGGSDSKKLQQPTNTPHLNVVNPTNIQNTVRHSKSFNEINQSLPCLEFYYGDEESSALQSPTAIICTLCFLKIIVCERVIFIIILRVD